MIKRPVVCPKCKGTGVLAPNSLHPRNCDECHGDGMLPPIGMTMDEYKATLQER